jgi:hypothetical protein
MGGKMASSKEIRYCEQCLCETTHTIVHKRPSLQAKMVERFAEKAKEGVIEKLDEELDFSTSHSICEQCGKITTY